MKNKPFFSVKKRTLLAIAGCVWLIAGINVIRLGILSYKKLSTVSWLSVLLTICVFGVFAAMFFKMSMKHNKRIHAYREAYRSVWHFFDLKSYIIMAIMMGGGIWLRNSGLLPDSFIAVFYTGLGAALACAGILFWIPYGTFPKTGNQN